MTGAVAQILTTALGSASASVESSSEQPMSPGDIAGMASRLAHVVQTQGIGPNEPVLVTIANRPSDLGSLLGVWLAGAIAVPLHGSASTTAISAVCEASAARFSVDGEQVSRIAAAPPPERASLRGAALIIFTSGSTGKPKGVVIGHEQFAGKLHVLDRLLRIRPGDRFVVPLQLTFIFGLWASILALRSRATLVLVPRFSGEAVTRVLDSGATVLAGVPSMFRTMLSGPPPAAPVLRMILTGGEAFGAALASAVQDAFPAAAIYDLYGLTETGSCDFCLGPADQPAGLGTIGAPTDGVEFRLVAEDGRAAPQHAPGELQIRSPFGMLGYLNDEALTEASFQDGFLKTGDLARLRSDGRVELVGRSKEIISRGGNKISPLELDNLLATHPDVAAALCAGVPDERLGESIHAVVVLRPGARLTPVMLRDWAAARLERFKLPDAIHFCDALPLGSTGKASRAAVADLARARKRTE